MVTELNQQQQAAVDDNGHVYVTACPGSGKTRVLTHRVLRELEESPSSKHRVVALTFTNRAAEEIKRRIDQFDVPLHQLWTGTIHAFALEWILRPYAGYFPELRRGFQVANEFLSRKLLDDLKPKFKLNWFDTVTTRLDRNGCSLAPPAHQQIIEEYHGELKTMRMIDFDMVLALAFRLLHQKPEVAKTLGSFMRLFCVDEFQDTQDLQYGILSEILKASNGFVKLFIVGDQDQAIYNSLGGVARTIGEIEDEFQIDELHYHQLSGNYRSSQRVIDLCQNFRDTESQVASLASHSDQRGCITFFDQEVEREDVPAVIANTVRHYIDNGVPAHEICVLAPRKRFVSEIGRELVRRLPSVNFDAPGLSPLQVSQDNLWFKLSKLFLTHPNPKFYRARLRLAGEVVNNLEHAIGRELDSEQRVPRRILRIRNSIYSNEEDGIKYLQDVIAQFLDILSVNVDDHESVRDSLQNYYDAATERLSKPEYTVPSDVESLRNFFRHPAGVVVNTCHGIKGEEYTTVICFGLLRGYVPNWKEIYDYDTDDEWEAWKMLYVVLSRAKLNIHLIAEKGRTTTKGIPYETTRELTNVNFTFDDWTA